MDPIAEQTFKMMKAAHVTHAELFAFMGEALCRQERDTPGVTMAFLKELIQRRSER